LLSLKIFGSTYSTDASFVALFIQSVRLVSFVVASALSILHYFLLR
jgi:hypothetical protein